MILQKNKNFFTSLFSSFKFLFFQLKKKRDYVIYSESLNYKLNYIDLLDNLIKKPFVTSVITSDLNEFHDLKKKNYDVYYIGSGLIRVIVFNFISCKYLIMTMTDIGNHLKKSLFCDNYVYFFHCMHSTHKIYTPKAFDNYDIIFCIGNFQTNEIRKNENINNLPKKKIVETGYFYLDNLERNSNKELLNKNTVLFAPSWNLNEDNLFNRHGYSIIENLLNNKFDVIFRPHPEIIKRYKNNFEQVIKKFIDHKNFILDINASNIHSMEKAAILITDNSSISIEYSFIFYRPVIFINYKEKIHNENFNSIDQSSFEDKFKNEIGLSILSEDIKRLNLICRETIDNNKINIDKIEIFKKNFLSNVTKSSQVAAEFLFKNNI